MGRLKLAFIVALLTSSAAAQQCGTITTCPPVSTPLAGTEMLYVVQAGVSKKMTVTQLAADIGPLVPLAIGSAISGGSSPNLLVQLTTGLQNGSLGAHLSLSSLGALSTDATGTGVLATQGDIAASLPSTSALYKGTGGAGAAQAATPGTDYITPSEQTSAIATALPSTAALYKGTSGAGVAQAATPGTDYVTPSGLTTSLASPPAIGGTAPAAVASTTLNPTGAITVKVRSSAASAVTVSATTDYLLCLDPTSNAIAVNLPASPATGLTFLVKDCTLKANTHNITITPNSGNIDNASTYVMNTNGQSVAVTYTGSQWSVN